MRIPALIIDLQRNLHNYLINSRSILKKDIRSHNSRLVFATYYDGVMAIGSKNEA